MLLCNEQQQSFHFEMPNDTTDWQMITSHSSTVNLYVNMSFVFCLETINFYPFGCRFGCTAFREKKLVRELIRINWSGSIKYILKRTHINAVNNNKHWIEGKINAKLHSFTGRNDQSWRPSHQPVQMSNEPRVAIKKKYFVAIIKKVTVTLFPLSIADSRLLTDLHIFLCFNIDRLVFSSKWLLDFVACMRYCKCRLQYLRELYLCQNSIKR